MAIVRFIDGPLRGTYAEFNDDGVAEMVAALPKAVGHRPLGRYVLGDWVDTPNSPMIEARWVPN